MSGAYELLTWPSVPSDPAFLFIDSLPTCGTTVNQLVDNLDRDLIPYTRDRTYKRCLVGLVFWTECVHDNRPKIFDWVHVAGLRRPVHDRDVVFFEEGHALL